jgi:hypothetical protein
VNREWWRFYGQFRNSRSACGGGGGGVDLRGCACGTRSGLPDETLFYFAQTFSFNNLEHPHVVTVGSFFDWGATMEEEKRFLGTSARALALPKEQSGLQSVPYLASA